MYTQEKNTTTAKSLRTNLCPHYTRLQVISTSLRNFGTTLGDSLVGL